MHKKYFQIFPPERFGQCFDVVVLVPKLAEWYEKRIRVNNDVFNCLLSYLYDTYKLLCCIMDEFNTEIFNRESRSVICPLMGCTTCKAVSAAEAQDEDGPLPLKACSCFIPHYCGKECQRKGWPAHKKEHNDAMARKQKEKQEKEDLAAGKPIHLGQPPSVD
eukprot:TRINITY_DN5735_c0_g1_i1.p1 TRINITY_DN5735_c0_g1~~TRINITY_DN5735_c0_g1_i1.p1  ORF type:complete len:162 (-),score=21.35 TRINITY_DN5735_c0_g1_i1:25-510(-)